MNAVSLLLRVLAILGALAAGFFFWQTQGKVSDLNNQLSAAKAASSSASPTATKELADAKAAVKTAEDAVAADKTNLKNAKDDAALAQSNLAAALADADNANKQSKAKDGAISDLNDKVTALTTKADAADSLTKDIAALQASNAALQAQVADMTAKQTAAPKEDKANNPMMINAPVVVAPLVTITSPAPTKILNVDLKDGLMALDAGTDAGVQKDYKLVLKSGIEELAQVVVVDSQSSMSTVSITSTGAMSTSDFSKIVTKGLKVDFQRFQ